MERLTMTARENDFESRLRFVESEVEGEKPLTRHLPRKTSCDGEEIAATRAEIATLRLQAERAAGDIALVRAVQASEGTMLNILTRDMREICKAIGQMKAQMDETRMEMGDMRTEVGDDMRTGLGDIRAILDAMDRSIDARLEAMEGDVGERFDAMQRNFDAVLAAIRMIAPHALPAPRTEAARKTGRRPRARRSSAARASTPRRSRNENAA
jgi:uncharacterized protein YukE